MNINYNLQVFKPPENTSEDIIKLSAELFNHRWLPSSANASAQKTLIKSPFAEKSLLLLLVFHGA